jgi:O-antigen ligase
MVVISVSFFSQNILNRAIGDIVLVGKNPHTIRTLSGRMNIWKTYIEVAKEKPIFGHGFAITTRIGKFRVNNAHNIILAIFLDLGIVGLVIFLWGAQRLARECIPSSQQAMRGQLGSLGVFIAVFVACQSTPFIATHWHAPNAVFTLFFALHTLYLRPLALVASPSPPLARPRHGRIVRDVRSRRFSQPLLH